MLNTVKKSRKRNVSWLYFVHGPWHRSMLCLYMILVVTHGIEHILQVYQAFGLGWSRAASGGLLGLSFPELAASEVLHFTYNLFQLIGLLVLYGGFKGRARSWWGVGTIFQTWHFLEHILLQAQWLTGIYLFNQTQQTSLLQMFVPRLELHFIYNMLVLIPTLVSVYLYIVSVTSTENKG